MFYLPVPSEWDAVVQRLRAHGAREVPSSNPYWNEHGLTVEDPDGYRTVVANVAWP